MERESKCVFPICSFSTAVHATAGARPEVEPGTASRSPIVQEPSAVSHHCLPGSSSAGIWSQELGWASKSGTCYGTYEVSCLPHQDLFFRPCKGSFQFLESWVFNTSRKGSFPESVSWLPKENEDSCSIGGSESLGRELALAQEMHGQWTAAAAEPFDRPTAGLGASCACVDWFCCVPEIPWGVCASVDTGP